MADRRDDITRGHQPGPADGRADPAPRRGIGLRTAGLVVGLLLALAGTAAVFLTEDARYLRVALLATCWAFLVAAFLAGGRRADQAAAECREAELRHAYDLELQREVAARKAHELELERRLRREAQDGMRRELAGLRADLAGLPGLRTDLAALGELRADLGRLRSELSEQLSGELLIERMVMRAQAVRLPADRSGEDFRTVDGGVPADTPVSASAEQHTTAGSRALVAPAPPAVFPVPGLVPGPSPVDRPEPERSARTAAPLVTSTPRLVRVDGDVPAPAPVEVPAWSAPPADLAPAPSTGERPTPGPATGERPTPGPATGERPSPVPRSRYRVGLDTVPAADGPAPHRHRRAAEPDEHRLPTGATRVAAHGHDAQRAPADPAPAPPVDVAPEPPHAGVPEAAAPAEPHGSGHARLEQILAGSGVSPASGRRRRRYRDEDDPDPPDDVLGRLLGRG